MSEGLFAFLAILLGGVFAGLQAPTNALLADAFRSPVTAAAISFLVGAALLCALTLVLRPAPDWARVAQLPWYAWLGGAYGAWFVVSSAFGTTKLGATAVVAAFLLGQLTASVAIDHFGLLGLAQRSVSLGRLAGLALVAFGVYLVQTR